MCKFPPVKNFFIFYGEAVRKQKAWRRKRSFGCLYDVSYFLISLLQLPPSTPFSASLVFWPAAVEEAPRPIISLSFFLKGLLQSAKAATALSGRALNQPLAIFRTRHWKEEIKQLLFFWGFFFFGVCFSQQYPALMLQRAAS